MSEQETPFDEATDATLTLHADGSMHMQFPDMEDEEFVPPHVLTVAVFGMLISSKDPRAARIMGDAHELWETLTDDFQQRMS